MDVMVTIRSQKTDTKKQKKLKSKTGSSYVREGNVHELSDIKGQNMHIKVADEVLKTNTTSEKGRY